MRALSLKQPWLHAITDLGKRVENRTWPPPAHIIGKRIALHASKQWDFSGAGEIWRIAGKRVLGVQPQGVILATATVAGWIIDSPGEARASSSLDCEQYLESPWFFGPWGWILDDVRKLDRPIACRGMLGLWRVPEDILKQIQFQEETQ